MDKYFRLRSFRFCLRSVPNLEQKRGPRDDRNDFVRCCYQFDDRNPAGIHSREGLRNTGYLHQYVRNVFRGPIIPLGSDAKFNEETAGFPSIWRTNNGELIRAFSAAHCWPPNLTAVTMQAPLWQIGNKLPRAFDAQEHPKIRRASFRRCMKKLTTPWWPLN